MGRYADCLPLAVSIFRVPPPNSHTYLLIYSAGSFNSVLTHLSNTPPHINEREQALILSALYGTLADNERTEWERLCTEKPYLADELSRLKQTLNVLETPDVIGLASDEAFFEQQWKTLADAMKSDHAAIIAPVEMSIPKRTIFFLNPTFMWRWYAVAAMLLVSVGMGIMVYRFNMQETQLRSTLYDTPSQVRKEKNRTASSEGASSDEISNYSSTPLLNRSHKNQLPAKPQEQTLDVAPKSIEQQKIEQKEAERKEAEQKEGKSNVAAPREETPKSITIPRTEDSKNNQEKLKKEKILPFDKPMENKAEREMESTREAAPTPEQPQLLDRLKTPMQAIPSGNGFMPNSEPSGTSSMKRATKRNAGDMSSTNASIRIDSSEIPLRNRSLEKDSTKRK